MGYISLFARVVQHKISSTMGFRHQTKANAAKDSRISLKKQGTTSTDSLESLQPAQGTSLQPVLQMVRHPNPPQDKTPQPVEDKSLETFRKKCYEFRSKNQNVMASRVANATNVEGTSGMDERRRIRLNRRAML